MKAVMMTAQLLFLLTVAEDTTPPSTPAAPLSPGSTVTVSFFINLFFFSLNPDDYVLYICTYLFWGLMFLLYSYHLM